MPTALTTGVGRIVWGHPAKSQPVIDDKTKLPRLKADGTPRVAWAFGVAFPKAEFQSIIWPAMAAEAATGFPQGVPGGFAWKYKDGDTDVDKNGKPYRDRDGYAGCFVLNISTEAFSPPIFKFNPQTGGYDQLPAEALKCGDFVSLGLSLQVNVSTDRTKNSSLYINPTGVEFVAYGQEIVGQNAIDPKATFGGRQHQLPPGASLAPMAPAGAPGMPMMPPPPSQPGMMPGAPMAPPPSIPVSSGYPQPGQMPGAPMQPGMLPPPAHDFTRPGGMPGMPGAPMQPGMMPGAPMQPGMMPGAPMAPPPPPPPPAGPQRPIDPTHIANAGTPYEQWWINGAWTPAGR